MNAATDSSRTQEDPMLDSTTKNATDLGQERVDWPDPSPLASWWDRVMYTNHTSNPEVRRTAR